MLRISDVIRNEYESEIRPNCCMHQNEACYIRFLENFSFRYINYGASSMSPVSIIVNYLVQYHTMQKEDAFNCAFGGFYVTRIDLNQGC